MKTRALFYLLATLILMGLAYASPRYTLIAHDRLADGQWIVEPIYTPLLTLTPLNAVAKGTVKGDALNCAVEVQDDQIYLTCDESRFLLTGFSLQE